MRLMPMMIMVFPVVVYGGALWGCGYGVSWPGLITYRNLVITCVPQMLMVAKGKINENKIYRRMPATEWNTT